MHRHDGFSCRPQLAQELDDRPFGGGVDPLEGLVHQIDIGVLGQRAGQENALLLTAGKLADLPVCKLRHADLVQCGHRRFTFFLPGSFQPAERAIAAHLDYIEHIGSNTQLNEGVTT